MADTSGTEAEKKSLIKRLTSVFKKGGEPEGDLPGITTERPKYSWDKSKLFELKPARLEKYKDYDEMDDDIVELSSSLDLHADFVVSAGGEMSETYNVEFEKEGLDKEANLIEELDERLQIKDRLWFMSRNVIKYGDAFYEVICSTDNEIVKIKFIPPAEVFINYKKDGSIESDIPYIQRDADFLSIVAQFAPWEIIHFKVGEDDYGVDYSLFGKLRRTFRVQRLLEDTVVVTRVARSNQRGKHKIDVTGMGEREALKYIRRVKLLNKRRLYFSSDGKLKTELDPLQPLEDIYVPVRKDRPSSDYEVVGGERHLGQIEDVEHFHNKLFCATKVPKAFLGYERDVNAKATLQQQGIAFMRVVRRHRYSLAQGLRKLYRLNFMINGVDPTAFVWKLKFPALGSPDEEAKWTIERLKAEVVTLYGGMGLSLPIEWIVRKLMLGLSPNEADELLDMMKGMQEPTAKKPAPQAGIEPGKSPEIEPEKMPKTAPGPALTGKTPPVSKGAPQPQTAWAIGGGDGKPLSESELDSILMRMSADERLTKLVRETEKAVKAALSGGRFEYY
jgi:hypothetical protein